MVRQARCSHILVDSYDQALDLQRRVYAGENFATLAAQYSKCPSGRNGGDLGWFGRGQMVKPFEDAAFSYNPGDMTIVQTQLASVLHPFEGHIQDALLAGPDDGQVEPVLKRS